jgi:predicted GIY-YIG superfamily endonuclease
MTSGIYKLKFEGTSKVYIGQSVNIEKRFKEHIRSLKNRTSAKKLLSGFDTFGHPSIVILEECKDKDLMSLLATFKRMSLLFLDSTLWSMRKIPLFLL